MQKKKNTHVSELPLRLNIRVIGLNLLSALVPLNASLFLTLSEWLWITPATKSHVAQTRSRLPRPPSHEATGRSCLKLHVGFCLPLRRYFTFSDALKQKWDYSAGRNHRERFVHCFYLGWRSSSKPRSTDPKVPTERDERWRRKKAGGGLSLKSWDVFPASFEAFLILLCIEFNLEVRPLKN